MIVISFSDSPVNLPLFPKLLKIFLNIYQRLCDTIQPFVRLGNVSYRYFLSSFFFFIHLSHRRTVNERLASSLMFYRSREMWLTKKSPIPAGHVGWNITEFLLGVVISEDEAVLAQFLLGLAIQAGVIEIALFRIREETLRLGTSELPSAQSHRTHQQKYRRRSNEHAPVLSISFLFRLKLGTLVSISAKALLLLLFSSSSSSFSSLLLSSFYTDPSTTRSNVNMTWVHTWNWSWFACRTTSAS